METVKLYYENAYQTVCTATVQECQPRKKGYAIILDRTVFYPEGGGQPGDHGTINGVEVTDTHEKDGQILHYTDEPLEAGSEVKAEIDWQRRFDLMQQHSGEHMVSGVVHRRWGYDNVGFHMGEEMITIDFSGEVSPEELKEVENEVNQEIWKNKPVKVWYPSPEELPTIPYRSKKELTGTIRIVEFPGVDICACCGTHVAQTGAIGLVKIISSVKFHEGVRVEMLSGSRAFSYLSRINEQNREISHQLSAKPMGTAKAVASMAAELYEKNQKLYALEESAFAAKAQELTGKGDVCVFMENLSSEGVRRAANAIQDSCGGRAAVFSGDDAAGYKYAVGLPNGDLREWVKELNTALNGRGGGKPFFVQGSVQAAKVEIEAFMSK